MKAITSQELIDAILRFGSNRDQHPVFVRVNGDKRQVVAITYEGSIIPERLGNQHIVLYVE